MESYILYKNLYGDCLVICHGQLSFRHLKMFLHIQEQIRNTQLLNPNPDNFQTNFTIQSLYKVSLSTLFPQNLNIRTYLKGIQKSDWLAVVV